MYTFSFSPPKNLTEQRKMFLTVTLFWVCRSVFNITGGTESISFSILDLRDKCGKDTMDRSKKIFVLRSQNDF